MIRDPTALLNIQIAFMGIVLVVGLFYLWKILKSIETKVDKVTVAVSKLPEQLKSVNSTQPVTGGSVTLEEDAMAQALMNEVFGGGASSPLFLHPFPSMPTAKSAVVVEEDATVSEAQHDESVVAQKNTDATEDIDTHSVVTTSNLSKSKVRKMSVDALREVCKERGLDAEGTKAVLMERVLAIIDE